MRTGQYKTVNVAAVCEGELIKHDKFTGGMEFDSTKKTSDTIVGYVAYFRLLNGFEKYIYMTVEETAAHGKKYSKTYGMESGKWKTDPEAMSLKTVLKRLLSKYGILSIDMQTAIQADQAVVTTSGEYIYEDNPESDVPEPPTLKEKLKKKKGEVIETAVIVGEPKLAPGPCPDNNDITYTIDHCAKCATRIGCPVFA